MYRSLCVLSGSLSGRPELEPVWRGSARAPSRLRRRRAASTSSGVLPARSAGWSSDPPRSRSACTTRHLPWYIARCVAVQPLSASARRGARASGSRGARVEERARHVGVAAGRRGVQRRHPVRPGRIDISQARSRDARCARADILRGAHASRVQKCRLRGARGGHRAGRRHLLRATHPDERRASRHGPSTRAFFFFCEKRKKFDLFVAHDVETRRHACTCTVRLRY